MLAVLLWHGLWKSLKCVEQSGSSERPLVLRSEHGPHPAGPQLVALNSRQPKKKKNMTDLIDFPNDH